MAGILTRFGKVERAPWPTSYISAENIEAPYAEFRRTTLGEPVQASSYETRREAQSENLFGTAQDKPTRGKHLPTAATERKTIPLYSGLLKYFPDALVSVAELSFKGNQQHNPGQPLHWAREKSTDQEDTLMRHLLESGTVDTDGVRHSAKVAWRALAMLQLEIEAANKKETDANSQAGTTAQFVSGCSIAHLKPASQS